ncbi:MAG: MFS transporter [Candidatus Bathyarchaeia archaeon]
MPSKSQSGSAERSLSILYKRALLSSFGSGLIGPFIPIYVTQLGASSAEIGLVQAINSVSPSIAQIPWGFFVDKVRRRTLIVALGNFLYAFMLLLLLGIRNVTDFIIVVLLAYVLSAMSVPALNSLIGELSDRVGRGKVLARINAMASLGSMPATVISGYIIYRVGGSTWEMYRIPIILCFIFNLAASVMVLMAKDLQFTRESFSVRGWAKALKKNPYFKRLCLLSTFQGFSMGLAWPLFTLTIVKVIRADMFQISLLNVISASTAFIVRGFTGRLADRAGRKPLIVLGRMGLFLVPLIYAIARSIYELIIVNFVIGILTAASDVAISAYLLDISPRNMRGSYTSLYNAISGSFTFLGSTFGGYLLDLSMGLGLNLHDAMTMIYVISIIGRIVSGALYLTLQEPYKYPAKFEEELKQIFEEEVETIERMIREYKKIEDEDLEWFERLSGNSSKR